MDIELWKGKTTCTFLRIVACLGDSVANKHFPAPISEYLSPAVLQAAGSVCLHEGWRGVTALVTQDPISPSLKQPLAQHQQNSVQSSHAREHTLQGPPPKLGTSLPPRAAITS